MAFFSTISTNELRLMSCISGRLRQCSVQRGINAQDEMARKRFLGAFPARLAEFQIVVDRVVKRLRYFGDRFPLKCNHVAKSDDTPEDYA